MREISDFTDKACIQNYTKPHIEFKNKFDGLYKNNSGIFRIGVCGKFKNGKTSLINEIFETNLPVQAITATGTVTKIFSGKGACVELSDGSKKDVSAKEVNRYILIHEKSIDKVVRSGVSAVYIGCNSKLLKGGKIEIWDTPGLEDDPELARISLEALNDCDMAIMVYDASKFGSLNEKMMIRKLYNLFGGNVLFVINRMDTLNGDAEIEDVKNMAAVLFKNCNSRLFGKFPVFFTSANKETLKISELRDTLKIISENESLRKHCKNITFTAKAVTILKEWEEKLEEDRVKVNEKLEKLQKRDQIKKEEEESRIEGMKRERLFLLENHRRELLRRADGSIISRIADAKNCTNEKGDWVSNYSDNAKKIMQESVSLYFNDIKTIINEDFPEINGKLIYNFPSPESLLQNMTYPVFTADNTSGMLAGAAAGAVIGSAVPGVGTVVGGVIGLFAGAIRDGNKDDNEKRNFENTCIPSTVTRYRTSCKDTIASQANIYCNLAKKALEEYYTHSKNNIHYIGVDTENLKEILDIFDVYKRIIDKERTNIETI
ncbi:MAG: dynamin family protein [Clostridiales bacterium]|nr:dynamin family protein [Clostridiales bacterium]